MDLSSALPSVAHHRLLASMIHLDMMNPPLGGQWQPLRPFATTCMMLETTVITKNTYTHEPYTLPSLLVNSTIRSGGTTQREKEKGE